jgi:hypothetical protein
MDDFPIEEEEEERPESDGTKPSQVPSWVMLGFVIGALCVMALPKKAPEEASPPAAREDVRPSPNPIAVEISTVEAVFEEWGKYASWADDTTEIALWNAQTRDFSDCYEVRRAGGNTYFRTIPSLTRPVLAHGVPAGSPLEFTETVQQRQQWLSEVKDENLRQMNQGLHDALAPSSNGASSPAK